MFDGGFLTLTLFAAMSVFGVALFTGETISISKIAVPKHLEYKGYTDVVVTHMLTDEIREMSQIAASELEPIDVDGSSLDKSVGELGDYFQLEQLLTGARDLFGSVPFYVSGEMTGEAADLTMTLRVFYKEENRPSDVVRVSGKEEDLHQIIHDSALLALEHINPYVVALYWQRIELAEGNFAFPRTRVVIDRYLQTRPVREHYLAYGLLGRMYMRKAEQQKDITPEGEAGRLRRGQALPGSGTAAEAGLPAREHQSRHRPRRFGGLRPVGRLFQSGGRNRSERPHRPHALGRGAGEAGPGPRGGVPMGGGGRDQSRRPGAAE